MADGRFDDLLLGMASKHKNVEELSYSILSFFERRTDLFHVMESPTEPMGFGPGVAEKMVMKQFGFFQARYFARAQPYFLGGTAEPEPDGSGAAAGSSSSASASASACDADSGAGDAAAGGRKAAGAGSGGYPAASSAAVASTASAAPGPAASAGAASSAADGAAASGEDGGALPESTRKMMRHISTWNGAVTDKYYWSQSLAEVTLEVEVEPCRAKDVKVDLTATRLSIKCMGKTVLEGKLHEKIFNEDSIWHLDENRVVLVVEKQRQTWWKCVLEGDEEIDTTKVESTRAMYEYDGETQGAIRKIMFDQNQKAMGKPTSDQLRTADVMRDAWNAPGSPFRGSEFDPTLLNLSSPVGDEFFADMEKRRLEEARAAKDAEIAARGPGDPAAS
eukprot:TRINITY_DN31183_c0_g1_i1.p1 TRINITY_DN31183_c0_g1~~TRINITY_DN31183_c0_g1_i1.p1  ORF type:complete len:392 (-),score=122.17 TRINITY_DN31183_c0_g1_i1:216-1391(-)